MTIDTIKATLFTNWHLARSLRLIFGVFIMVQAIATTDFLIGMIASLFLFQAITNTGCCGVSSCAIPNSTAKEKISNSVLEYEEIKSDKRN